MRTLRQKLPVYIQRIHRGERFEVTDRGRCIALLVPLLPPTAVLSQLERLMAEGRATRPVGDLLELEPLEAPTSTAASEALLAVREDRL